MQCAFYIIPIYWGDLNSSVRTRARVRLHIQLRVQRWPTSVRILAKRRRRCGAGASARRYPIRLSLNRRAAIVDAAAAWCAHRFLVQSVSLIPFATLKVQCAQCAAGAYNVALFVAHMDAPRVLLTCWFPMHRFGVCVSQHLTHKAADALLTCAIWCICVRGDNRTSAMIRYTHTHTHRTDRRPCAVNRCAYFRFAQHRHTGPCCVRFWSDGHPLCVLKVCSPFGRLAVWPDAA